MTREPSWREFAYAKIMGVYLEAQRDGADWPTTLKRVDAAYPFHQRKYHPYKQWLNARRDFIAKHGPQAELPPGQAAEREFFGTQANP